MNFNDRRVRKTKKALQLALAELMNEKDIRNITVRELTERADIHRATFYTHYQDVYDLYEQLENNVIEGISEIIVAMPTHTYDDIYRGIIDYIFENIALCKMFLGEKGNQNFKKRINRLMEECYLKIWLYEDNITEITAQMRYITVYHIGGCLAIIERWVDSGLSESKENIIEMLRKVNDYIDNIV